MMHISSQKPIMKASVVIYGCFALNITNIVEETERKTCLGCLCTWCHWLWASKRYEAGAAAADLRMLCKPIKCCESSWSGGNHSSEVCNKRNNIFIDVFGAAVKNVRLKKALTHRASQRTEWGEIKTHDLGPFHLVLHTSLCLAHRPCPILSQHTITYCMSFFGGASYCSETRFSLPLCPWFVIFFRSFSSRIRAGGSQRWWRDDDKYLLNIIHSWYLTTLINIPSFLSP